VAVSVTERAMLVVGFAFSLAASAGVLCLVVGFSAWPVLVGFGVAFVLGVTFGPGILRRLHQIERG
jgi:hypothetical protein